MMTKKQQFYHQSSPEEEEAIGFQISKLHTFQIKIRLGKKKNYADPDYNFKMTKNQHVKFRQGVIVKRSFHHCSLILFHKYTLILYTK